MPAKKKPANWTDAVANESLAGIFEAQRVYKRWTDDYCSLRYAPEYLVTTYIAKRISTLKEISLTLENNVKDAIDDAGGLPPGKPPHVLRYKGKFDILIWTKRDSAIIEVKRQVYSFTSPVRADVSRICATLNKQENFKCGFMAYYTFIRDGESRLAKKRLKKRMEGVADRIEEFAVGKEKKIKRYPQEAKISKDDEGAWGCQVLKISW